MKANGKLEGKQNIIYILDITLNDKFGNFFYYLTKAPKHHKKSIFVFKYKEATT